MGLLPYKNEVYLDWADEKNVGTMNLALKEVEAQLGKSYPLVIAGKLEDIPGFRESFVTSSRISAARLLFLFACRAGI